MLLWWKYLSHMSKFSTLKLTTRYSTIRHLVDIAHVYKFHLLSFLSINSIYQHRQDINIETSIVDVGSTDSRRVNPSRNRSPNNTKSDQVSNDIVQTESSQCGFYCRHPNLFEFYRIHFGWNSDGWCRLNSPVEVHLPVSVMGFSVHVRRGSRFALAVTYAEDLRGILLNNVAESKKAKQRYNLTVQR